MNLNKYYYKFSRIKYESLIWGGKFIMKKTRGIDKIIQSNPTIEGAGVRLKRVFGHHEVPTFDPFLLLDDFHSNNPDDYLAGFPWHPTCSVVL